jgi:hypothetical protein
MVMKIKNLRIAMFVVLLPATTASAGKVEIMFDNGDLPQGGETVTLLGRSSGHHGIAREGFPLVNGTHRIDFPNGKYEDLAIKFQSGRSFMCRESDDPQSTSLSNVELSDAQPLSLVVKYSLQNNGYLCYKRGE